jgi:HK97 family phage major capsid protein
MTKKIKDLLEKRAKHVADARAIYARAESEKREPNAEERSQFDNLMEQSDQAKKQADDEQRLHDAEKELAERRERQSEGEPPGREGEQRSGEPADRRASPEYRAMFETFIRGGMAAFGPTEHRALQADIDNVGGYLRAPQQMLDGLIKFVDDNTAIRPLATVIQVTGAESLGAPSLDTDPDDGNWTSEIQTGSEDSAMRFGKRELHPHPLAKRIKVSAKLLRLASRAEGLVRDRLGYKFAITEDKAFLTGTGVNQPLGVFTASAMGISTSRDVQTGSATDITADALIDAKYALKEQYMRSPKTRWLLHRDFVKRVRKLKDSQNQYLWQPGLQGGQPDRLLDVPIVMSEYVPNTFTTAKYVGAIGDFSYYWIADAMALSIQRLVELYAETNQIGFIGRMEVDGMPVLEEAFVRLKTN